MPLCKDFICSGDFTCSSRCCCCQQFGSCEACFYYIFDVNIMAHICQLKRSDIDEKSE